MMEGKVHMWKASPEAETSARVQSGHDPEPTPCEERGGGAVCSSQDAQRYREWATKTVGLYREEKPSPLDWRVLG